MSRDMLFIFAAGSLVSSCQAFTPCIIPSLRLSSTIMKSNTLRSILSASPRRNTRACSGQYMTKEGVSIITSVDVSTTGQSSSVPQLVLSGQTPLAGCVVNLIKNIVGSGVLCLAGSVAAFSDEPSILVIALGIAFGFAAVAAYSFALIARTCQMTGAKTYTDAWSKSVGASTAWLPNVIVIFKTWSACLIYSIIVGDLFSDLALTFGITDIAGIIPVDRTSIIIGTHAFGLLPLCLLRSFAGLSYASLLGVGGILYTAAFMTLRLLEGSYLPGGVYFQSLAATAAAAAAAAAAATDPSSAVGAAAVGTAAAAGGKAFAVSSFGVKGTSVVKSVILISTLTSSYLCHYNAPKFLIELKDATAARFQTLTYSAFFGAFGLNAVFMVTGFLAFGGLSKGLILNNYATSDTLATLSRGAIGASIVLGYPLTFEGFRSSLLELLGIPAAPAPPQALKDAVAVVFLLACGAAATALRDLGAVVSFFGAILGSAVIYVLPALMYRAARRAQASAAAVAPPAPGAVGVAGGEEEEDLGFDYRVAGVLIPAGSLLGLLGAAVVVLKATTDVLK